MELTFFTKKERIMLNLPDAVPDSNQYQFNFGLILVFSNGEIEKSPNSESEYVLKMPAFQVMTETIHCKMNSFIDLYKENNPRVHQFQKFIGAIPIGEYFAIVSKKDISLADMFYIMTALKKLNDKTITLAELLQEEEPNKGYYKLFGKMEKFYNLLSPSKRLGEPNKLNRICIFCNKSIKETTFDQVAHLIPQSLGNKQYIQNEECDSCNNKFGRTIDNTLTEYLNPYRLVFKIGNKNELTIKYLDHNTIRRTGDMIEIKIHDEKIPPSTDKPPESLNLTPLTKIKLQDVYRALSRIAISCLGKHERASFSDEIRWINGEMSKKAVPIVFRLVKFQIMAEAPYIILYQKKKDVTECDLPCLVAELHLQNVIFIYVVQTNAETNDFTGPNDLDEFWNVMDHYNKIPGWKKLNLSSDEMSDFILNLEFKQMTETVQNALEPSHDEETSDDTSLS